MEHFSIITTREFLNKIGNKSFILMTILLPIIVSGLGFLLTFLSSINNDTSKLISVVDKTGYIYEKLDSSNDIKYDLIGRSSSLDEARSISESKSLGGDLGWIEENTINKNLKDIIKNLKIGEFTEPQVIPGGFLILKLKDIREENISMNIENELQKLIKLKTNQQLNQFSNIYFNKVRKDVKIEKI